MYLEYTKAPAIRLFDRLGIFSAAELKARNEVNWETFAKLVQIEARTLGDMAINHIIPAATAYQTSLLKNVALVKSLFPADWETLSAPELAIIKKIAAYNSDIKQKVDAMVAKRKIANRITDDYERAMAYHEIAESFAGIRRPIDKLEEIVDDNIWPLPKYRELLWIR